MANSERLAMGDHHIGPNAPRSKLVDQKLTYRLFPAASQQPQISPRTLSKRTLKRTGSLLKRRSASLDEPLRANRVARVPLSLPDDAPVPRLQPAPSNRAKATKPSIQDRDALSHARHFRTRTNGPGAHDHQVRLYMPRVSEDAGHGRSSSAPDDMAIGHRVKKLTGLSHVTNASLPNSAKVDRGLGGTWYNARDSSVPSASHRESNKAKDAKPGAWTEKPLPLPPKDTESRTYLDPSHHQRSHSTPLSPGPRSEFYLGPRSDSATELTPLKTPSSLDPNRKSYFPLSADARMRELMGMGPIEEGQTSSVPPMPILSSNYQESMGLPAITVNTDVKTMGTTNISPTSNPTGTGPASAPADPQSLTRPQMHSPTLSQASSRMVPAALRIPSPKRNAVAGFEKLPTAPKAGDNQLTQLPAKNVAIEDDIEKTMSTWAELTVQTATLHARYSTLREDRQFILSAMTQALREQRPGPDYVNTILDQQMSLTTCCSSMDICLAKLKAVARRKDTLAKTLATHALLNTLTWGLAKEQHSPTLPTPAASIKAKYPSSVPDTDARDVASARGSNSCHKPYATQYPQSRLESEYDTDDSEAPRRMNLKGVKAARILGLNLDGTVPENPSRGSSTRRPTHTLQTNLSTTSLDRDQFTRTPIPAPSNTLPTASAQISHKERDLAPSWSSADNKTVEKFLQTTHDYVDTSTSSSRASSPADERGAETPDGAYAATFDDPKSPGQETVHVYFPESASLGGNLRESTLSEAGEDELLEYYGCYK